MGKENVKGRGALQVGLKFQVPLIQRVFLPGQTVDSVEGNRAQGRCGVPSLREGSLEGLGREAEVDQKIRMRAIDAVVGLAGWQRKDLLHQAEVQVQQERPMEEQEAAVPALGVAGELKTTDGQVGLAAPLDGCPEQRRKGLELSVGRIRE
jgi:hypothetical protein